MIFDVLVYIISDSVEGCVDREHRESETERVLYMRKSIYMGHSTLNEPG